MRLQRGSGHASGAIVGAGAGQSTAGAAFADRVSGNKGGRAGVQDLESVLPCRGTWVGSRNLRRCCNGGVVSAGDRDVTVFGRVEGSRRRDDPHTGTSFHSSTRRRAARAAGVLAIDRPTEAPSTTCPRKTDVAPLLALRAPAPAGFRGCFLDRGFDGRPPWFSAVARSAGPGEPASSLRPES